MPITWFGYAVGERGWVPLLLSVAVVSWFALDEWLLRRKRGQGGEKAWRSSIKMLLCVEALSLAGVLMFWAFEQVPHPWLWLNGVPFVWVSVASAASCSVGAVACVFALLGSKWGKPVTLGAAVVLLAAQVKYAAWMARVAFGYDPWQDMIMLVDPGWRAAALCCGVAAGAGSLLGWLERRASGGWDRTAALLVAWLWAWVAVRNLGLILPFHHLCYSLSPKFDRAAAQAGGLIGLCWVLAIALRLLWHWRSRVLEKRADLGQPPRRFR